MMIQKQVQILKQKAGLCLSLFLMLVNQIAAQAGTVNEQSNWPANGSEKPAQGNNSQSLGGLKALSAQADRLPKANSIVVSCSDEPGHTIKLRPFMANRKLPSRRDLQMELIEQKGKLAQENDGRLTGQVSTFVVGENNNAMVPTYKPRVQAIARDSARANVGQTSVLKNIQSKFTFMRQAEQNMLSLSKQQAPQASVSNELQTQMLSTVNRAPTNSDLSQNSAVVSPNQSTPSVQSDWTAESSGPSAFSIAGAPSTRQAEVASTGFGSAGPPPFPLNLLPEASLKQLIKSLAGKRSVGASGGTSVAFGSWHSPTPLSGLPGTRAANLPYAGFQSHLQKPYASSSKTSNHRKIALNTVSKSPRRSVSSKSKPSDSASQRDASMRNKLLIENRVRVASYPTYSTQSLRAWNFAQ